MVEPGGCDVHPVALLYRDCRKIIKRPHSLVGKRGQSCHASQCQQKSAHEIPRFLMHLPRDSEILLTSPPDRLAIWSTSRAAVKPARKINEVAVLAQPKA